MSLLVKKIFSSIQGEGYYSGTETDFIRLAGCNVKCPIKQHCDTDYSGGQLMDEIDILKKLNGGVKTVCITGGEPLEQNIRSLCIKIRKSCKRVHLQTSGLINMCELQEHTSWIVCSPKAKVERLKIKKIDEMKVVYIGQNVEQYYGYANAICHYLQPYCRDGVFNYTETVQELSRLNRLGQDWRISLQMHKYMEME